MSPAPGDPLLDAAGISAHQLADVLGLLTGSDITELDVTLGSTRLSLRRSPSAPVVPSSDAPAEPDALTLAIASPLVGVFRPSVTTGQQVTQGQPIGAIEALGMPSNVDAPHSGTVDELLVQDGTPVEYGQPLVILRRESSASP